MEKHIYFPDYADDLAIFYTIIDTDPLEVEISSIAHKGNVVSEWLLNLLLDQHESDWIREIMNELKARRLVA